MSNIIVLPMVLPLLTGIFLVFIKEHIYIQRWVTFFVLLVNGCLSGLILYHVATHGILRLDFGGWIPPFGILFVADSFALLLVTTTSFISAFVILYAMDTIGAKRERLYFYPFTLFLIAGVIGSFLTGDIFNLFVTFEVMLISSYVLLTLGASRTQLMEAMKYIAINVVASSFFLIAIAYLYGTLGTLNMAHLSVRIAEAGQTPIITTISLLFLVVFGLKAALLLYQWLPGAYSTPPTAIAALFGALLTKVGVYAIVRVFTLLFYHETTITHILIAIMASLTMIGGALGAIAYTNIRSIVSYNVVISIGFMLIALAVLEPVALEGFMFYLVHDMVLKALLFLIAGTVIYATNAEQIDEISGLIQHYPGLGWSFFITVLALSGIPPLSGFIGKLLIAQGAIDAGAIFLIILGFLSSLIVLYSLMRMFMNCFWGETIIDQDDVKPLTLKMMLPISALVIVSFALGFGAEWLTPFVKHAAATLVDPSIYIDAVLTDE